MVISWFSSCSARCRALNGLVNSESDYITPIEIWFIGNRRYAESGRRFGR